MADAFTVYYEQIDEQVVPGKRLGRRGVKHDSRSLAYAWRNSGTLPAVATMLDRHIPILDQGDVGSCTGNAETGALGTTPLFQALDARPAGVVLNEATALALYSAAETIDGDGPYPPNDNGSYGLSVAQAAKNEGLISGYTHCLSLADVLDALASGSPVIIGSGWYDSFDNPDSTGVVSISAGAQVRGGHEYLARGQDPETRMVLLDNSWGAGWGVQGSFSYSWATLERLLSEQGDGTVSVPLTSPVPVSVPVPTPTPTPTPDVHVDSADRALVAALPHGWENAHHVGDNGHAAVAVRRWRQAKGL